MGNQLLASKVAVVEEEPRIRNIATGPTAIPAFILITEKGPVGVPTLVTSFEEYVNIFGGHIDNSDAAAEVEGFFSNGGSVLYIVRTVHYTDITNAATKTSAAASVTLQTPSLAATAGSVTGSVEAPFNLEPGDDLDIAVDGGGAATATFDAAAASVTSGNTETFALTDGDSMSFDVEGVTQTVVFNTAEFSNIAAATAAEVAAVINAEAAGIQATENAGAVVITTDKRGTDAAINNFADNNGTPVGTLGFTGLSDTGTGDVADIDAVTFSEAKTVIEADVAGVTVTDGGNGKVVITSDTTGASSSVQVEAGSTADDEFGFDNATHSGSAAAQLDTLVVDGKYDGDYANDLQPQVADATSGETDRFNFLVLDSTGLVLETFPNVSMDDTDDRYVETIVNDAVTGSHYLTVTDQDAATTEALQRPENGTFVMTGGDDGLTSLDDNDFIGSSAGPTGIRTLDNIEDLTILAIPGRASSAVHNAMITYGEVTRAGQVFSILDPPANQSTTQIITYVDTTAGLQGLTEFAAIYWPRIKILNPSKAVFGNEEKITIPPSGHIAGVYSRTDSSRPGGVYDPPAGVETGRLFGVLGFETEDVLDEAKRDLVFPKRINPLTTFSGASPFIDGARTLKGSSNFPTIAERRGVSFIERSIKQALEVYRHKNNTPSLRAAIARTVEDFLRAQLRFNAFRSTDPAQAFFVDFGAALNPASAPNIITGRIGLATAKPAEFIVLRFSQDTRAIEAELAS